MKSNPPDFIAFHAFVFINFTIVLQKCSFLIEIFINGIFCLEIACEKGFISGTCESMF